MPKFYCDYCLVFLSHSSPGGRKQHCKGKKHIQKKIEYYQQFLYEFSNKNLCKCFAHKYFLFKFLHE